MTRILFFATLIILSWCEHSFSDDSLIERPSHADDINYDNPVEGGWYLNLTISSGGKIIRTFHGDFNGAGVFEREDPPLFSPDGKFVLLNQIELGEVEIPGELGRLHEVAYCEVVEMRTGCIVARNTGEFCGGNFTQDAKWKNQNYPDLDLVAAAPKVNRYLAGKLRLSDYPENSIDNLLFCDPPREANRDAYIELLELLRRNGNMDDYSKLKAELN